MTIPTYSSTTMDIHPDLASEWLGGNIRNRPISQRVVNQYAADMRQGRWRDNHVAIAFDRQGTLIDGQHRLWAVIESGCTVRMLVVTGLEPGTIEIIGEQYARSAADQHNIVGHPGARDMNTSDLATLRVMIGGMEGDWGPIGFRMEHEAVKRHAEAVQFAVDHVRSSMRGIGRSYVRAVLARAWHTADQGQLKRFCRVLSSSMPETPADAAIIKLRNQLINADTNPSRATQRLLYRKVERVLFNWLRMRQTTVIRPVHSEHFLLPEEVTG